MISSPGRFELLIGWINQETQERSTSWEAFDQINKDAPAMVKEFFASSTGNLSYEEVL
jgi:hypothetical protein